MHWILRELFGNQEPREIEDVEYEDLTPPISREETYEDFTDKNPGEP